MAGACVNNVIRPEEDDEGCGMGHGLGGAPDYREVGTYSRGMTPRVIGGPSRRGYADLTHDGTRHMTRRNCAPSTID